MREIVLDTETTGFEPAEGDRIVEIGAVELIGHIPTGRTYHQYINPKRSMPKEAFEVHGLGDEFLADKPVFADIAGAFLDFIGDAQLVIHNASFDMKFLNAELSWVNLPLIAMERAVDTLAIARLARCPLPPLWDRQFRADAPRRLARQRNLGRCLSRADWRPAAGLCPFGEPDPVRPKRHRRRLAPPPAPYGACLAAH